MKFIVLEGLDGAGKSTQVSLLTDFLNQQNINTKFIHFPRTDSKYFGELVANFLRGDFGDIDKVNPYLVALLYAGDRKDASDIIKNWINEKYTIVADRYVYSNIAYQCAKLKSDKEKEILKNWILDFEFNYYKIPKPDLNIFLDVPFVFTKSKLSEVRTGHERNYLNGNNDIHENDLCFQEKVRTEYLNLCSNDLNIKKVNCYNKNNEILAPQDIFNNIKSLVF